MYTRSAVVASPAPASKQQGQPQQLQHGAPDTGISCATQGGGGGEAVHSSGSNISASATATAGASSEDGGVNPWIRQNELFATLAPPDEQLAAEFQSAEMAAIFAVNPWNPATRGTLAIDIMHSGYAGKCQHPTCPARDTCPGTRLNRYRVEGRSPTWEPDVYAMVFTHSKTSSSKASPNTLYEVQGFLARSNLARLVGASMVSLLAHWLGTPFVWGVAPKGGGRSHAHVHVNDIHCSALHLHMFTAASCTHGHHVHSCSNDA